MSDPLQGITFHVVHPGLMPYLIALYKKEQKIGISDPGVMDWRLKRQFSKYYPKDRYQVIGAYHLGRIIGFVAWHDEPMLNPYENEPVIPTSSGRDAVRWHDHLIVGTLYRCRGVGTRLMEEFISHADSPRIRNSVWEEWLIDFYGGFGFKLVTTGIAQNKLRYWILERTNIDARMELNGKSH